MNEIEELKQRIKNKVNELRKIGLSEKNFKLRAKTVIYQEVNKNLKKHKKNVIEIKQRVLDKISQIKNNQIKEIEKKALTKVREKIKTL